MRTKKLLITIVVMVLSLTGVYAQKVVVENGKIIIDALAIGHTIVKKPRTTNGTNTTLCTQNASDIASKVNDEKVYKKFEVSKTDNDARLVSWKDAIDICAGLTDDGGGWRLPTRRELMLMWVLMPELDKVNGFTPFFSSYNSATQSSVSKNYYVAMDNGTMNDTSKAYGFGVRCIRDL